MAPKESSRSWSDLPSDLLFTIFKKLKERDAPDSHKAKLAICSPGDACYRIIRRGFSFKAVEFPKQPAKLAFVDNYLVELNGKFSLVQRFINSNAVDRFCVYNLDRERRTKVENIGDNVIILGKNSSKTVAAGRGFVANCVYFIDDAGKNMSKPLNCEAGLGFEKINVPPLQEDRTTKKAQFRAEGTDVDNPHKPS
ncbi:hypothetical protein WN943_002086 [Citrus x changshan-huyou]